MPDFAALVDRIIEMEPGVAHCRDTVEKEVLHHELLGAMRDAGLLRHLTFKGGTCLRLCHQAPRLSEHLDFSGGAFDASMMDDIEDLFAARLASSYGLEVTVQPPRVLQATDERTTVRRWTARVVARPSPPGREGRLQRTQRIKIEIDERTPGDGDAGLFRCHQRYALLGGEGDAGGVRAATLADIGSDKLVALPMSVLTRDNPRHRDAWDLMWINGRMGAASDLATRAAAKAASRRVAARYGEALRATMEGADELVGSEGFRGMLRRLFPEPLATDAFRDPSWRGSLVESTRSLCAAALRAFEDQ